MHAGSNLAIGGAIETWLWSRMPASSASALQSRPCRGRRTRNEFRHLGHWAPCLVSATRRGRIPTIAPRRSRKNNFRRRRHFNSRPPRKYYTQTLLRGARNDDVRKRGRHFLASRSICIVLHPGEREREGISIASPRPDSTRMRRGRKEGRRETWFHLVRSFTILVRMMFGSEFLTRSLARARLPALGVYAPCPVTCP